LVSDNIVVTDMTLSYPLLLFFR